MIQPKTILDQVAIYATGITILITAGVVGTTIILAAPCAVGYAGKRVTSHIVATYLKGYNAGKKQAQRLEESRIQKISNRAGYVGFLIAAINWKFLLNQVSMIHYLAYRWVRA